MRKTNVPTLKASLIGGLMIAGSMFNNAQASSLKDVIDKATISGFAFTRIQTLHGKDGDGTRWQWRFRPTITTGEVSGWSASAGIFFSKGTSTPDSNTTDNDISGSRGDRFFSASDTFNIADFFITYNAKEQFGKDITLRAGQKNAVTPFNDTNLDRAMGIYLEYKDIPSLNIGFQWWDTWMGDDIYISRADYSIAKNQSGAGIGNNVFMLSLSSAKDFTDKTGISYQLWYAYIHKFAPYMTFGEISYTSKFGSQSLTILGQISATGITKNPILESGDSQFAGLFRSGYTYAKNRGMYNIRADYKYNFSNDSKATSYFSAAVGFAGSFGDGYGTLIDNTGGLKLGGNLWNSFSGAEANGFGILGVGGFAGSSITLPYVKVEYGYKKLTMALDVAYVDTTHFFYMKKGSLNYSDQDKNTGKGNLYTKSDQTGNKVLAASFLDISPSVVYKFTDSLNMAAYYGYLIGKPSFGRFRFQVNYLF